VTVTSSTDQPASPLGDSGLVLPPQIRLRLDLSYDGTEFSGWARQPQLRTVAQVVEDALATVLRLEEPPVLTVAGRTDAGVHAIGQVAHVDVPSPVDADVPSPVDADVQSPVDADVPSRVDADVPSPIDTVVVQRRLRGVLPDDVSLRALQIAPAGFHARFAALGRHYVYRIADGVSNPLRRRDTASWSRRLDVEAMQAAATSLLGEHDFAAYCRPRAGATTIRTLRELSVTRDQDAVVLVAAHADAFCHNQVRSMVGALLAVGEGRRPVEWPAEVLRAGVRDSLVNVAPAHGLTLVAVDYPPADELADRAAQTRQRRQVHS
jgi:tRNA pseudouridine38-40 synthase